MAKNLLSPMLDDYDRDAELFSDFTNKIEGLLKELLKQHGIRVHSINARVKDRASLRGKIGRSDGKYTELSQITDIVGIRIITYYSDEVDAIANILEQEFEVDLLNSVDKRELLDPDRFGYLSMHYVVKLPEKRLELTEYARFRDCKAEVQIRSILQHTWAEIEHDLGYKSKQAIPKDVRRSFSRLAGLLELADLEFAKIRQNLTEYENEVSEQIHDTPAQVLIDQASLKSYISNSKLVHELDQKIASLAGAQFITHEDEIGDRINRLSYFGLMTISDLDKALQENKDLLIEFARHVFMFNRADVMVVGISLFYLCHILIARTGSLTEICEYLETTNLLRPGANIEALARDLLTYYKQSILRLN
jgi:putative GTP pyrophosphokinase